MAKTTPTTSYRFQRHYPALQPDQHLTVQNQRQEPVRILFTQSDIDSACGLHCLAMALSILDLAKGCALQFMSRRKYGVPAEVWSVFEKTYFVGVEPHDYVTSIKQLNLPLSVTARYKGDRDLDTFAITNLMRGELVALCFKSIAHSRTRHWALGVGTAGAQHGQTAVSDTLLLLDPSCRTEPSFGVSNARLRLPTHGAGSRQAKSTVAPSRSRPLMWQYDSPEWSPELVCLTGAVRLRRSDI
jgi:hypothetical protein